MFDLLQKSRIDPTISSNLGSARNDFDDFKINFPAKDPDFIYKKFPKRFSLKVSQLEQFSNTLKKYP